MATLPTKVQPGDLITADLMNALLDKCLDLESRLADLEGGPSTDKMMITKPAPGDVHRIGEELRIEGQGFGTPSDNTVFIDGSVQVKTFKTGSNDKLLIITLPFVQNVPDTGRTATLTVSRNDGSGFATTSFTIDQPEITVPTGTVTVTMTEAPNVPQIDAGQSYTFIYTAKAATTADEVYTVSAAVDAGWTARLVDGANNDILPQELFIQKPPVPTTPTTVTFRIRVTIPGGLANGTVGNLSVTLASKRNPTGLRRTSDATAIAVAGTPPAGDLIGISLIQAFSPASKVGNDIVVAPPASGQTTVFATFKVEVPSSGAYTFDAITFKNDPLNLWSATVVGGRQGINMQAPQATVSLSITVKPSAPAAKMVLKVTSDTNATIVGDIDQNVRPS
jgi:hypothetical protein